MLLIGTDKFCTWKISLAVAAPQMKNFCRAISQTPNQNLVPLPGLKIIMLTTKCVLLVLESQRWVQRLNIQSCLQFSTDHPFALDLPVPQAAIETWRDEFHPLLAPPPPRVSQSFGEIPSSVWTKLGVPREIQEQQWRAISLHQTFLEVPYYNPGQRIPI